jgi:hypothetical protein
VPGRCLLPDGAPAPNETKGSVEEMRSNPKAVFIALVAVFAVSAVASSSALAAPEWYAKKAGVYAKITTAVAVKREGTIKLTDKKGSLGGALTISCKNTEEGTVGAGVGGTVSKMNWTSSNCACVKGCEAVETLEWRNLPISTELFKEGAEIRNRNLGEPSLTVNFKEITKNTDICKFNTSAHMKNTSGGEVEEEFEAKSAKTKCSLGGAESGEWTGVEMIKANQTGVEAIKVE